MVGDRTQTHLPSARVDVPTLPRTPQVDLRHPPRSNGLVLRKTCALRTSSPAPSLHDPRFVHSVCIPLSRGEGAGILLPGLSQCMRACLYTTDRVRRVISRRKRCAYTREHPSGLDIWQGSSIAVPSRKAHGYLVVRARGICDTFLSPWRVWTADAESTI